MTSGATQTEAASSIAILAGNSRIGMSGTSVHVQAQLVAFDAALARASEIAAYADFPPRISIAFDHQGIFRRQFLKPGLTNSQQRNPRLSHLRSEAVECFAPTADKWNIPLDSIFVIHEDSARTRIDHLLSTKQLPPALLRSRRGAVNFLRRGTRPGLLRRCYQRVLPEGGPKPTLSRARP